MAPNAENSIPTVSVNALKQYTKKVAQPLNVLIVSPVFPPYLAVGGGVAITYKALEDKLLRRGHEVTVLSSRLDNIDHGDCKLYKGFPVIMPTLHNLRIFEEKIRRADVVVAPETCVLPFLNFFCQRFNTPLVMNVHTNVRTLFEESGAFGKYFSAPVMDSTMRFASKFAARTFTTSPSYRDVLLKRGYKVDGVFSPRIKTAIFEDKHDPKSEIDDARDWLSENQPHRPLMIYVGRWSHEKRIDYLVKCKPTNFTLAIVGDGPIADQVMSWHNPKQGIVCHRGMLQQERIRILYKAADLLVSASAFETLGMTVAEAHLCGTAAAVQAAPGFVTQIVHGQNGFLVDYAGDVDAAKSDLEFAMNNLPTREQVLSTTGRSKRWDAELPNLEEEIEHIAKADRSDWTGIDVPMSLFWPIIIAYFALQYVLTLPFNRVTFHVKRDKKGTGNINDVTIQ